MAESSAPLHGIPGLIGQAQEEAVLFGIALIEHMAVGAIFLQELQAAGLIVPCTPVVLFISL